MKKRSQCHKGKSAQLANNLGGFNGTRSAPHEPQSTPEKIVVIVVVVVDVQLKKITTTKTY